MLLNLEQEPDMGTIVHHPQTANVASATVLFGLTYLSARKSNNLSTLLLGSGASLTVSVLTQNKDYRIQLLTPIFWGIGLWFIAKQKILPKRFAEIKLSDALASSLVPNFIHSIFFTIFCFLNGSYHLKKGEELKKSNQKEAEAHDYFSKSMQYYEAINLNNNSFFGHLFRKAQSGKISLESTLKNGER